MMSPPSGYSSGETDAPFANSTLLESVRSEVDTIRRGDEGKHKLITASANGFGDSNEVGGELGLFYVQLVENIIATFCPNQLEG